MNFIIYLIIISFCLHYYLSFFFFIQISFLLLLFIHLFIQIILSLLFKLPPKLIQFPFIKLHLISFLHFIHTSILVVHHSPNSPSLLHPIYLPLSFLSSKWGPLFQMPLYSAILQKFFLILSHLHPSSLY